MKEKTTPQKAVSREQTAAQPLQLLLLGAEPTLLYYRELIFRSIGLRTQILHLAQSGPDRDLPCAEVAVFCHTLLAENRKRYVEALRNNCPGIYIICLSAGGIPEAEKLPFDQVLDIYDGPYSLVESVRERFLLGGTK